MAMADVAEPRGPAGTGGPVVAGMRFTAVADRTGASGPRRSETGEPVVTGIRFQIGNDMTEASGLAVTGAGGSVGVGKGFRPVSGIAEAGGPTRTGAGGPVVAGTRFLAVAEVYAPFEEMEGDPQSDISKFDQISETITEVTSSRPLEHAGATGETVVSKDPRRRTISENGAHYTDPDAIWGTLDTERGRHRLWLAWWGQQHPCSSRDGLMMLKWNS